MAALAAILVFAVAQSPLKTMLGHPLATALTTAAVIAYYMSLVTLSRLRKPVVRLDRRRLWYRSLICNVILVGIVVSACGANAGPSGIELGLVLCVMELIAIVLHVVALTYLAYAHDS